jgi:hypothetical protein
VSAHDPSSALVDRLGVLTDQAWREDIDVLHTVLANRHRNPYYFTSSEALRRGCAHLRVRLPDLTLTQRLAGLLQIPALLGDGHTRFRLIDNVDDALSPLARLPVSLHWYSDGLHVRRAHPDWANLNGARLVGVEQIAATELFERLLPLVSRENMWRAFNVAPRLMTRPALLAGVGVGQDTATVACQFQTSGGSHEVILPALPSQTCECDTWSYATANGEPNTVDGTPINLSWSAAPDCPSLLYLKFDSVSDDANGTLADRFEAAFRRLDADEMTGLVIDLRNNGGGDNRLNWPLIEGIKARPSINQPERLFALTGRGTFSAALHCALWLQRHTQCRLVGEPTGNSPNHFGDAIDHELPNTGLTVAVSSLWWQESDPYDDRPAVTPDLRVEYTAADYARGHDAALTLVIDRFRASMNAGIAADDAD